MIEKRNKFNWALIVVINVVCGILFVSLSTWLISTNQANSFTAFLASLLFVAGSFLGLPIVLILLISFQYRMYAAWCERTKGNCCILGIFFLIPCMAIVYQSIRFASVDWLLVSSFLRSIVWSMLVVSFQIWLDGKENVEDAIFEIIQG